MSNEVTQVENLETGQPTQKKRKNLWLGLFVVALLVGGIFGFGYHQLEKDRSAMESDLEKRQRVILSARAESGETWLRSIADQARRLVSAELFQLFASEVNKLEGGIPLFFSKPETVSEDMEGSEESGEQLASQLPLMRSLLTSFTSENGFLTGRIVNSKAEVYMSTEAQMEPLSDSDAAAVLKVVKTGEMVISPMTADARGLSMTFFVPILPPLASNPESKSPVAVLVLSRASGPQLVELLSPGLFQEKGQSIRLVQRKGDVFQEVNFEALSLRSVKDFTVNQIGELPFDRRASLISSSQAVYSSAVKLRMLDWWMAAENEAETIDAAFKEKQNTVYMLSALFSLVLVLLVVAGWWRFIGREQSAINDKFRELLTVIDEQKHLLNGINSTITDPISLTNAKGDFAYVNTAFARVVGREEHEVVGLDGPAVFGFDTAKRLTVSDQHVMMTGESVSISEVLWLQSKRYYFQISKSPLMDSNSRTPQGIVSVYRDITQLVEAEQHSRRVVQQTINALVRTIEEADPFLGGHSRIMGGIAGLIAKQLGLARNDIATIEAAANLSQIGKMFVPRSILLKPGALTPDEKKEMEKHVEHACNVLKDIEFDLPVLDAIKQMNERLDGQGYPEGLREGEISMHARVMAVSNAFAAMARPRSYRPAMEISKVLSILGEQTGSYDQAVVNSLREVIATPAGERIVEQAANTKAV